MPAAANANYNLDERLSIKHVPFVDEQLGFHVEENNNVSSCCQ